MTPTAYAEAVAAELRAEMARKRKTQADLASTLGVTQATAARRMDGSVALDILELAVVANWLEVPITRLLPPDDAAEAVSA